jgi:hypothetical protein
VLRQELPDELCRLGFIHAALSGSARWSPLAQVWCVRGIDEPIAGACESLRWLAPRRCRQLHRQASYASAECGDLMERTSVSRHLLDHPITGRSYTPRSPWHAHTQVLTMVLPGVIPAGRVMIDAAMKRRRSSEGTPMQRSVHPHEGVLFEAG